MKKPLSSFIALSLAVLTVAANLSFIAAKEAVNINEMSATVQNASDNSNRIKVLSNSFLPAKSKISDTITGEEYATAYLLKNGDSAAFSVNIPHENTAYNVSLIFDDSKETAENYEFSLNIDGAFPFDGSSELSVNTLWVDDGDIRTIPSGDQVNPAQKHMSGFKERLITDSSGINLTPYEIVLTKGIHEIKVTALGTEFVLAGLVLETPEQPSEYSIVAEEYGGIEKYNGKQIEIEGEKNIYRSSFSLTAKGDNGSPDVSPSNSVNTVINYVGGSSWSSPGDEIAWQFEAPKSGLYKIGFSYKQSEVNKGSVYRWLKIDGKTPFKEATEISFPYSAKWKFASFADESGKDYLIYLTEGTHTISLEVTLAQISEVYKRLSEIVNPLGDNYLDMVMITGESPDSNRNYQLNKQIPDFESKLKNIRDNIDKLSDDISNGLSVNGELDGALKNMARILNKMINSLYNCHIQIPSYYSAYQTLSAWLYDIKTMSLSLDQIILAAPDEEFDTPKASFFENLIFGLKRFTNSYTAKNDSVIASGKADAPTLKLWVNWGRDQVKVLNTIIQDSFATQNGINVKIEQVNASLVQGVVSGNSPDLYLNMSRTEPVNLAMRGVVYDLSKFNDFNEVLQNFQAGAEIPYLYKGGCYALPDTQSFYVMYYRTDILNQLGVEVPKTWDDFITATGILQRNKLNTYLPYVKITAATTVNAGAGGLSIFPTMLLQSGGNMYNEQQSKTELNSQESISAFNFWTNFYTKYSLEPDANFTQKFRVGTAPLGIMSYTSYLTWSVAAPEIKGKWKIAEIPGMLSEDGKINNTCSGSGTGCVIMKSSKNKEAAWEFLKWWVSADTQYKYSSEVEAVLGETGRVATSNIQALSRLSWDEDALSVINSQWKKVNEIPEVPGSYFVARSIDQAFWATKNGKKSSKEAIMDWAEICNKEVERKIAEYADKKFED